MIKATEIVWGVDDYDILCELREQPAAVAAERLGLSLSEYSEMSTSELLELLDSFGNLEKPQMIGLPIEVVVPNGMTDKDTIEEWLTNKYSHFVDDFNLVEDEREEAKVTSFFVLDDDRPAEVGARIVEDGRESWVFFDQEGFPTLYKMCKSATSEEDEDTLRGTIGTYYRLVHEGVVANLPHIEEATPAMRKLWEISDSTEYEWDGIQRPQPGYSEDDFRSDFGMFSDEFIQQVEGDIKKYNLPSELIELCGREDSLYCVSNKLAEYFSQAAR